MYTNQTCVLQLTHRTLSKGLPIAARPGKVPINLKLVRIIAARVGDALVVPHFARDSVDRNHVANGVGLSLLKGRCARRERALSEQIPSEAIPNVPCFEFASSLVAKRVVDAHVVDLRSCIPVPSCHDIANFVECALVEGGAEVVEGRSANGPVAGGRARRGLGRQLPRRLRRGLRRRLTGRRGGGACSPLQFTQGFERNAQVRARHKRARRTLIKGIATHPALPKQRPSDAVSGIKQVKLDSSLVAKRVTDALVDERHPES